MNQQEKWDRRWLADALHVAKKSKDPNTQVGAVLVRPLVGTPGDKIAEGWNGFPRGLADSPARLNDRDTKLKIVVHAEQNAVLNAGRIGVSCIGATMYIAAYDKNTGRVWGGAPCTRCTVEVIQAGIVRVVSYPLASAASKWHDDCKFAASLLHEVKIELVELHDGCGNFGCEILEPHAH